MENKENEYGKSLELWSSLNERYNHFWSNGIPTEGDLIKFLLDIKNSYPLMFALEQRYDFQEMRINVCRWINTEYRHNSGRASIEDSPFTGIFGEETEGSFGFNEIIDFDVHKGKPTLTLDMVAAMADAIERNERNRG